MRRLGLSLRTEEAYVGWVRRLILANGKRHPRGMGAGSGGVPDRAGDARAGGHIDAEPGAGRAAVPVPRGAWNRIALDGQHPPREEARTCRPC